MSRLGKIIQEKCPNCEQGDIFISKGNVFKLKMPRMHQSCSHCQHKFEREPGYFFGAMYVSYAFVVAQGIATYVILQYFIENPFFIIGAILLISILLSNINYRYSRIVWMYLFTKSKSNLLT